MTDNDDKPDIQNSGISNEPETVIQNLAATEDKTLFHSDSVTHEGIDEPTRQFAASPDQAPTNQPTRLETEPTKILPDEAKDDDLVEDEPDENALRPGRLRFALICLFFVFVAGWCAINLVQQLSLVSEAPEWIVNWDDKRFVVVSVMPIFPSE